MDCRTARKLVDRLPPRLDGADLPHARDVEAHLGRCSDCRGYSDEQSRFDDQVRQAMRAVAEPEGLRERLLERVANERRSFYRRWGLRSASAAAAAVLLGVALYFALYTGSELIVKNQGESDPVIEFPVQEDKKPESIEWMFERDHNLHIKLPKALIDRWNFELFEQIAMREYNGHVLPALEFKSDQSKVVVVLVPRSLFDPNRLSDLQLGPPVLALGDPAKDEYIALVFVITGNPKDFERPPPGAIA